MILEMKNKSERWFEKKKKKKKVQNRNGIDIRTFILGYVAVAMTTVQNRRHGPDQIKNAQPPENPRGDCTQVMI